MGEDEADDTFIPSCMSFRDVTEVICGRDCGEPAAEGIPGIVQ